VLAAESVSVPAPIFARLPDPAMTPESVVLFACVSNEPVTPEPIDTELATVPVTPACSVPLFVKFTMPVPSAAVLP
jgi:hypothetical protein